VKDRLVERYVRCLNYAEELRIIAKEQTSNCDRENLRRAADHYDRIADTLVSIIRSKVLIEGASGHMAERPTRAR